MQTIVLATQKGGSGKSTLAIGLALAAQKAGHNVRLIETDQQGTLSNWQSRRGLAEPIVETVYNPNDIETRLWSLDRGISASTTAAIRHADLCLIPARPSVADIEASTSTLGVVRAWRKPFAFVINQAPIRGQRIDHAANALCDKAALELADVVARPFIVMRNDHQDALAAGLAVSEYAPSGKSTEEIRGLWQWADIKLNGGVATDDASEVEFPIMLAPAAAAVGPAPEHALPTWDEAGAAWDTGL
jgi:chromosome partitioning protein